MAVLQWAGVGKTFTVAQWLSMCIQGLGMVVRTRFDGLLRGCA